MPHHLSSVNTPLPKNSPYIYAAPTHSYVFTAPIIHHTLPTACTFKSARATITLTWETTFDQAGLLLAFPHPANLDPDAANAGTPDGHPLWIKADLEMESGKAWVSSVTRGERGWADWTLCSPSASMLREGEDGGGDGGV
ncbi:Glutamate decarboxylase [Venturia inaequalis]|nr:Glutamate decarboxylase [Venturia inaequalis]